MNLPATHVEDVNDQTGNPLCGYWSASAAIFMTTDPLNSAVGIENRGENLCRNCKRVIRARFGSIKRWENEDR